MAFFSSGQLLFFAIFHLYCAQQYSLLANGSITNFSPSGSSLSSVSNTEDDSLILEPINGTRDYRINSKKDHYDKPWFDSRDFRFIHCVRSAKCEKLRNNTCFGSKLPYSFTSLALTDSFSQEGSQEKLYNYEALRNIPKCWAVIQPFLCAVFAPKCERIKNRDMVYLPSLEMCRITLEPCRVLYNTSFFPKFLKCNETFFPSKCNNDVREMKFNGVGQCMPPLMQAESSASYYKDIEGCGIQCKNPLYTEDEHESIHQMIGWGVAICAICNIFVIATYSVHEWKKYKYPAKILLFINICFLINWIGWSIQFLPGQKENIVCRKDGTLRHSEPSAGENLSCLIPFVLIYYFLMAAMVWFALFTYAWFLQTSDRAGNIRDSLDKSSSLFHLIAWPFPLVLTIIVMALSEVDGSSIVGICFVGYQNHAIRIALVLVPVGGLVLISIFFICRGLFRVNQLKKNVNSSKASSKLNSIVGNVVIRATITMLCIGAWIIIQVYEFRNSHIWAESLNEMILCKIKSAYSDSHTTCKLEVRPSVAILQLRLWCIFVTCIANSSWCWTGYAVNSWSRYIKRKLGQETSDDEKFTKPKHKVIAGAYAKRNESVLSVSIQNTHTDPAGVNFNVSNLNLNESNGMTSTLLNYMVNLLSRRNAVTSMDLDNVTKCRSYASSFESEKMTLQYIQKVSVECESRRSSIDSTVSVKMSETEIKVKSNAVPKGHRMKTKNRRKYNRRASSSSIESQIITATKKFKYRSPHHNVRFQTNPVGANAVKDPKMGRRGAYTGFDVNTVRALLKRQPNSMVDSSDDDAASRTSVKIHNAQSNIVVRQGYNQEESVDGSEIHLAEQRIQMEKHLIETVGYREILHNMNNIKSSRWNGNPSANNDVQSSTLSESSEMGVPLGITQSSNSGISIGNKTHSRNSKGSCDVGIQANAFDIQSQTRAFDEIGGCSGSGASGQLKAITHSNYDNEEDENYVESHHLLSAKKHEAITASKKDTVAITDSQKLKMLLLPSK